MAFQTPRHQTEDLLAIVEEPQYRASQETTPRAITITGSSTMTTTTIVDASISASFIGCYAIPEDGNARGQVRQITSVSGTTATVDVAWNSTTSVTSVRFWKPAEVPVRSTGSGSTTTVVSSDHANITNEPDDYWNVKGYHLWGIGGNNAGKAANITDFATATGTYTVGDTLTSTVTDELYLTRKTLRPEGAYTVSVGQNSMDRQVSGYSAGDVNVPLTTTGGAQFELPRRGVTTAASSTVAAVRPLEIGDIIAGYMTEDLDTGMVTSSDPDSGGTNTVTVSTEGVDVGSLVLANTGEVGQVRSISSNTLTLGTSHVTVANVAASANLYASAWYKRKDTGFRTFTLDYYMGGLVRKVLHGCGYTLNISISRDQIVRFAFNFTSGEAFQYTRTRPVVKGATLPIDILDTSVPFDAKAVRCLFNGVNVLISEMQIDMGFNPVLRPSLTGPNNSDGMIPQLSPIKITARMLADEDDRSSFEDVVDLVRRRACVDLLVQHGTAPGDTWAFAIPAFQVTDAPYEHQDGQGTIALAGKAVLPQTVPGNSFNAALSDFVMGWM